MDEDVQFGPGSHWTDGTTNFTVVGMAVHDFELSVSVWAGGSDYRTYTPREVIALMCEAKWLTTPELVQHADDDELVADLPAAAFDKVLKLEAALYKARTGFSVPTPSLGAKADPAFSPPVPMKDRMKLAAAEVGLKEARFYGIWRKWEDSGRERSSLVHGNTKPSHHVLDGFDPAVIEFVRGFIARHRHKSTKDRGKLRALLLVEMTDAGHEALSVSKLDKLLTELSRGQDLFGNADSRQTKSEKPTAGGQRSRSLKYGANLEVDSSQMNFMIWSPGGQEWLPVWGIFIEDVATRITTVRLTTSAPSKRAFALALARMMMPPTIDDLPLPFTFVPVRPDVIDISPKLWPALKPNDVHQDGGKEYENAANFDIYARVGATPRIARTRTPKDKPHIESAVGKMNRFAQLLGGHKGDSVKNRGKNPEREPLLTFEAAQAFMDVACVQSMYEPHSGLPHPMMLNKFLSPMQAYNIAIADRNSALRVGVNPNVVFELLDLVEGTISGNEVTVGQIVYRASDPSLMRSLSAGDSRVASRPLRFRRDPNDVSRLFWHVPGGGRWQTLKAVHQGTELPPFSDVLYNRMLHEQPRGRLSKQERLNIDVELRRLVLQLQSSKAGRQELSREFARLFEAVADPANDSEQADGVKAPSLTVIDGGGEGVDGDIDGERPTLTPQDQIEPETESAGARDDGDYESRAWTEDDFLDGGW